MAQRDRTLSNLGALLRSPEYRPGTRLPPERELASKLKVSRRVLREGLEVLEAQGRIWRQVGQGTFVGERPPLETPTWPVVNSRTSPSEVLETRLLIEPLLARAAALRATELEIAEMKRLLQKSEAVPDAETWELWDGRLHRAIAAAAHNNLLLAIFETFNAMRRQERWSTLREATMTPSRHAGYCAHHRKVVAAIAARDPRRAEEAMQNHIEAVRIGFLSATVFNA